MRTVFIGAVDLSFVLLSDLLTAGNLDVVGIVSREKSSFNSDFRSLSPLAQEFDIPLYIEAGNDQDAMADWVENLAPEIIFCFGWSYLLDQRILNIPERGVVGYHPAMLPKNRGRHPLIWALALGLEETGSTFFQMNNEADSGPILNQVSLPISDQDDAGSLYQKMEVCARNQIKEVVEQLLAGNLNGTEQDSTQATYWRKRSKEDGHIDWRMPSEGIVNLVRALASPYPGAHCTFKGQDIKIWKTSLATFKESGMEPGKVISCDNSQPLIKTSDMAVLLEDHEFTILPKQGEYLL